MPSIANVYLLKDLSRLSGHSVHTLKFYLKRRLISESGRSPETRFRYFDDSTLARLARIRSFRKEHKSLSEIQRLLTENGSGLWAPRPAEHESRPPRPAREAGRGGGPASGGEAR